MKYEAQKKTRFSFALRISFRYIANRPIDKSLKNSTLVSTM
jgi:hypothetical protein